MCYRSGQVYLSVTVKSSLILIGDATAIVFIPFPDRLNHVIIRIVSEIKKMG